MLRSEQKDLMFTDERVKQDAKVLRGETWLVIPVLYALWRGRSLLAK